MRYPQLSATSRNRQRVDIFRGYNHNLRISEGEFFDMQNMSSDRYPVLAPRKRRGFYKKPASPQGLIAKDEVCYVDGSTFVVGQTPVDMGLSVNSEDCPKQLVSMGAYVVILPDKMYINTKDLSDFGPIEATFTAENAAITLCDGKGEAYNGLVRSAAAPGNPADQTYWLDTSAAPVLKCYSAAAGMWAPVSDTCVKIAAPGIGTAFSKFDGVTIGTAVESLNGAAIIQEKGEDYLVISGILSEDVFDTAVTIARQMPNMDYLTEAGNRLWGCRYGLDAAGNFVNEIYACALGDFKNWNCFRGLSTDSYAAACGTDGSFTGAASFFGAPLFFKENCVHKVYGSYPANFHIQDTACRGVQSGCSRSLAIVGETLFYKSRGGICAFDGSLPVLISEALGSGQYFDAVAGAVGSKYYVSMKDESGDSHLFVFDTRKNLWHREDDLWVLDFCACKGELYCIDGAGRNILTLLGSGLEHEQTVSWMVQTGELGADSADSQYLAGLSLRMALEPGAKAEVFVSYDDEEDWDHVCTVFGTHLRSFPVPIRPRRCDYLKLRIEGQGAARLYAITKITQQGSDTL